VGRSLKAAAVSGIGGPILFAVVLISLSFLQNDFMRTLGWDPLTAPTRDWPSGLALGPWGFVMTATFMACGLLLVFFAFGMRQAFRAAPAASTASNLLTLSGFAMSFLAFSTDPTNRASPATLHGRIHDGAFVVLGVTLLASLVAFGFVFRGEKSWRANAVLSWVTATLIVPSFTIKGITFYFFLVGFLAWCETAAFKLWRRGIRDES